MHTSRKAINPSHTIPWPRSTLSIPSLGLALDNPVQPSLTATWQVLKKALKDLDLHMTQSPDVLASHAQATPGRFGGRVD